MAAPSRKYSKYEIDVLRRRSISFTVSRVGLSFNDFDRFVGAVRGLVSEVAYATTRDYGRWILTDLAFGSARLSIAALSERDDGPGAPTTEVAVESNVLRGLAEIRRGDSMPSYFSERALQFARTIVRAARDESVRVAFGEMEIALEEKDSRSISGLLKSSSRYYGSVLGDLDVVSVRRGVRGTIYGDRARAISCSFDPLVLPDLKDLLGQRVLAVGRITANRLGAVLSVRAEQLFSLPRPVDIPSVSALYGAVPDFTDGASLEEFRRNSWADR